MKINYMVGDQIVKLTNGTHFKKGFVTTCQAMVKCKCGSIGIFFGHHDDKPTDCGCGHTYPNNELWSLAENWSKALTDSESADMEESIKEALGRELFA